MVSVVSRGKMMIVERVLQIYSTSKFLHRLVHPMLDRFFRNDSTTRILRVPAGPLKGFQLELNLKWERQYLLGKIEFSIIEIIRKLVNANMICYDIGAHIGYYALILAQQVGFSGRVFAFEPNPSVFARLQKNIALNSSQIDAKVELLPFAIGDHEGPRPFFKGGSTTTGRIVRFPQGTTEADLFQVECRTLDSLVFGQILPPPDLVKIDVEWAEHLVLEGMRRVLDEFRPVIICEIHDFKPGQDILDALKKLNYFIYSAESKREWFHASDVIKGEHLIAVPRQSEGDSLSSTFSTCP
jgi:FkbM family methyltransferase